MWKSIFVILGLFLASCGQPAGPTPDVVGTRVAEAQAIAATLTADVPTATDTPLPTDTPSPTPTHTPTARPTLTPVPLLQGKPTSYIPTQAEMPAGFSVDPNGSDMSLSTQYPASAVLYSRSILELVAYVVVVAPDERTAKSTYDNFVRDQETQQKTDVEVSGADEHMSFLDPDVAMVKTFVRYRNLVAAVAVGGLAVDGADYYVALLTNKLEP